MQSAHIFDERKTISYTTDSYSSLSRITNSHIKHIGLICVIAENVASDEYGLLDNSTYLTINVCNRHYSTPALRVDE